ncbi:hypothetical protein CO661_13730 [Sinorhizobium fredii]|uniref:Uncharacterized protein n=1 Tax=Rhizobium fredii TaxID=380 RepID=A0A2A6LXH3_RHIFR|nr:hypothetical protein CO661_13730 [Sinorhizobium fredii]
MPRRIDFATTNPFSGGLQRRASYQTHRGGCSTLNCCMFLPLNRLRLKETCSDHRRTIDSLPAG